MKIKHVELEISAEAPFANCKLDREKYAKTLTEIVGSNKDGFVLAIDNEWGNGKTTFVKMWQKQLELNGIKTLYFNAWENDFDSNPLVAIISELNSLTEQKTAKDYRSMVEKGAILFKNIAPVIFETAVKKYTGSDDIANLAKESVSASSEILNKEIEKYTQKKEGLKEFKVKLEKFIEVTTSKNPLVFIVDELDRCRPTYAVEVLEQIKHLFSVPGIVFVLAIDKIQLGHAVRGVYGNDRINADEYLRRFIDIEFVLPNANAKYFCDHLYEYFDFDSFFISTIRNQHSAFRLDKRNFLSIAQILFEKSHLTLRQQEKIFAHARLSICFFKENNYLFPEMFLFLIYIKKFHVDFYNKIKIKFYTLKELLFQFKELIPKELDTEKIEPFIFLEATLVFMYNNSLSRNQIAKLIVLDGNSKDEFSIVKSELESGENTGQFFQHLKSLTEHRDANRVGINYLFDKIDLLEDLTYN